MEEQLDRANISLQILVNHEQIAVNHISLQILGRSDETYSLFYTVDHTLADILDARSPR
jgi:hypothetical protein